MVQDFFQALRVGGFVPGTSSESLKVGRVGWVREVFMLSGVSVLKRSCLSTAPCSEGEASGAVGVKESVV